MGVASADDLLDVEADRSPDALVETNAPPRVSRNFILKVSGVKSYQSVQALKKQIKTRLGQKSSLRELRVARGEVDFTLSTDAELASMGEFFKSIKNQSEKELVSEVAIEENLISLKVNE